MMYNFIGKILQLLLVDNEYLVCKDSQDQVIFYLLKLSAGKVILVKFMTIKVFFELIMVLLINHNN